MNILQRNQRLLVCCVVVLVVGALTENASAQVMMQNDQIQIEEDAVVSEIFGYGASSIEKVQEQLAKVLETRVDLVARECDLSEEQRETLLLAGQGDIHRFLNDYQTLRRKIRIGIMSQEEYREVREQVRPVQTRFSAGLYNRDSLLQKTIPYVLENHQRSRYETFICQRRQRQYEAIVHGTLAMLENEMPLTSEQRKELIALLMTEIPDATYHNVNYSHQHLVLYQMSKLPSKKLEAIFLENEWDVMRKMIQHSQGYKQHLIQQGVLIDD